MKLNLRGDVVILWQGTQLPPARLTDEVTPKCRTALRLLDMLVLILLVNYLKLIEIISVLQKLTRRPPSSGLLILRDASTLGPS